MGVWFFVSDLHGDQQRYRVLLDRVASERPTAVLLGGDILGTELVSNLNLAHESFIEDFLVPRVRKLRDSLGERFPAIAMILGNDDPRVNEAALLDAAAHGLWHYVNERRLRIVDDDLYGYAYVPPSPFLLKDWECYDVSRYVDPGCVSPEEGYRTIPIPPQQVRYRTISDDLEQLTANRDVSNAIFLFHAPPYQTKLDRAALDGRRIDHVPLDVHVGSIAIRRFIEARQPLVTLHGHIHESARLTGQWRDRIGRTCCMTAAHDGPELALIRFDPAAPACAERELLTTG